MINLCQKFSDALFKPGLKCIACRAETLSAPPHGFCDSCLSKLPIITNPCLKCGTQLNEKNQFCIRCKSLPHSHAFDKCISSFSYEDKISSIIYEFKYSGARYLSRYMAESMHKTFKESGFKIDRITYVPSCKSRLKMRGYNQAQLLAKDFHKLEPTLPLIENVLVRKLETNSQTEANFEERQKNL